MHARVQPRRFRDIPNTNVNTSPFVSEVTERYAQQAARLATLTQSVASALLAGVERATALNNKAAHEVLDACRAGERHSVADDVAERWRFSWNAYRVCVTTTGSVLDLCRTHGRADLDSLWRVVHELANANIEAPFGGAARRAQLQSLLGTLEQAQTEMLAAAARFQGELVAVCESIGSRDDEEA
jgi:hypothetical protein